VQAQANGKSGHGCGIFFLPAGDGTALERLADTLQTTALVHEVYLRLADLTKADWKERAQFFAMAAQMMRRILVDAAFRAPSSATGISRMRG
jgi:hypothetical protein